MIVPFVLLAFAAASPTEPPLENPCANGYTENVWDPRFAPGERWSYRNRPVDQDSTLVITKIDDIPGIGIVIQITVENVDLIDDRGGPPLRGNNNRRVPIAIRRDSLDASALQMLGIVQSTGPDSRQYTLWKKNCKGLTYATTVDEAMQTEHNASLISQLELSRPFAALRTATGRRENFKITLSALPQQPQSLPSAELTGSLTTKDGKPVKDAEIEIQLSQIWGTRNPPNGPGITEPLRVKTKADGSFHLPALPPVGAYSFKLTMDGFQPAIGTMTQISPGLPQGFSVHFEH